MVWTDTHAVSRQKTLKLLSNESESMDRINKRVHFFYFSEEMNLLFTDTPILTLKIDKKNAI